MTAAPIEPRPSRPEVFSTTPLREAARVEGWERHNAESLVALTCRPVTGATFDAAEMNLQLNEVHLARVRAARHTVERSAGLVEEKPADAIAVYAGLRGDALLEYDGVRRVLHPGQLLVCDVDRPFLRGFGHGLEELAVKVPRQAFAERTGLPSMPTPLVVEAGPGQNPHRRALVQLVGRALRAVDPVPADEEAILDLVSVLATEGRVAPSTAHRSAAKAFIEDHLADPTLSAADVALGAGVSERHLSRLFAEAGTSVPRHILARRLDRAFALLSCPTEPDLRTVDIAQRCGFTSASYFSAAFRKRFGVAAGDVRRGALA